MANDYERRLLRVIEYIHDNPAGDLSLDRLADVAAMSRFHWHRVFHAMTGETCAAAVRRIRLHLAAVWLVQKDWPIAEVAKRSGYPNLQSFTRIFSDGFGVSPGAFRQRGELPRSGDAHSKGGYPVFPIEIQTQPARRLAALHHQGAYTDIGKAFEQVSAVFTSRGLWEHATGMIGVYYDDPDAVPEADLKSVAGVVVGDELAMAPPLEDVRLPEGRYAIMHYKGPYSGLAAAYRHMYGEWLPKSGEDTGDHPPFEIYLNSPAEVAPDELLTDVCVPLR